ncbi:MAG: Crp/Fnr family transcriptional regulator [Rhodobacteraceae bacterium]|nr:Crp/Fnr family transcriptional regulator [Paracoccaceae bacterium]
MTAAVSRNWLATARQLDRLDPRATERLAELAPTDIPKGTTLFRPGDAAKGFLVVLEGRVEVYLTGPSGRDILLYAVEPGGSCVQTTLGLLGGEDYTGEAVTALPSRVVLIPRSLFLSLMDSSPAFRTFVFGAFAGRMQDMMHLLERVAFQRIESRLARALLERAVDGSVEATHQELAALIGSAREVVSRRLEVFAREGWVSTVRGSVSLTDPDTLRRLAAAAD